MRPSIGLHLALIIIHGGILVSSSVLASQLPTISQDEENLKYIKRKRNSTTNSAPEFVTYNVIQPKIYHVQEKREIDINNIHPKAKNRNSTVVQNINELTITFMSGDLEYIVDLQINHQLIPKGYFQKYHKKGKHVIERPSHDEIQLCHYNGKLRGISRSWAALSTCGDAIEGVLYDGRELHFIEKVNQGLHYHYRGSDHLPREDFLSHGISGNLLHADRKANNQKYNVYNRAARYKRDISNSKTPTDSLGGFRNVLSGTNHVGNNNDKETHQGQTKIQGPWNANKRSRYVELLLVVDNKEYKDHNEDLEKVYKICKDVANVMNALYSPLNIYIALVGIVVWTEYDEIKMSTNGDKMLTNFLHYRRERLVKDHPNDNAQLLTGVVFEGGVVGKALKGPICTYEFSGGVNMWHSDTTGLIATTVAHEMGHNFGMEHDTEDCECPDDRCIMAPASSAMKPTFWSSCSLEYLAMAFEHGMDYCLRNKPVQLFEGPVCGNGFVEKGEECDCGLKDHCDNPCCNPSTCKLFANATCATGSCCDFQSCQPKPPGSICRDSEHECDLPEYCTGENEFCPNDVFKVDGTSCKMAQAFCYDGTCRTHSDQCKLLWGPSGKKSDNQCYEQNRKGTRHGNCGYNRLNQSYVPCKDLDVRCGMLHCSHLNERLEFGMESVAILSHSFINSGGRIIPCRTALVDLGLNDVDPGLAPEGARCADGSLCVNQKCLPVASLMVGPKSCPNDCNGHGTCNSKGNCHCDTGYAPPLCILEGSGGSKDSGPASQPSSTPGWMVWLIVCLVVIPLLLLCLFVAYHRRRILQISKDGTPEEWRIWIENANPATKFKRHSDQQDGSRPSRPTSLLTQVDISAPMQYENGQSSTSSPTHALLPHVDTSTSALSAVDSDKVQKECNASSENVHFKRGAGNNSIFGSITAGLEKSRSKIRSKSFYGGSTKDRTTESGLSSSNRGRKRGFMETLAKSISLPSPKIRGTMKSNTHTSTKAHYEITVEHQEPRKDSGDQSPPILTPCDIEDKKSVLSDCLNSAQISSSNMSNDTSKDNLDSSKNSAFVQVKKVDTTVTVTNSNNLSKSLSSFATTSRVNAPYRTTLPASKSYSFRTQAQSNKDADLISNESTKNIQPMKTEKDSSSSLASSNVSNEQKTKDSLDLSNKDLEPNFQSSVSVNNNLQTDKNRSRYPLTKKPAFPHSSTFSGRSSDNTSQAFLPSSKSCDSTVTAQRLSSKIEGNDHSSQNAACRSIENSSSNNNKGINTSGIEKKGIDDLVSSKMTQNSTAVLNNTAALKPSIAKKPPTPPRKPNYLKSKEVSDSMKAQVSTVKNVTDTGSSSNAGNLDVAEKKPSINTVLNKTLCKEHEADSKITLNLSLPTKSSAQKIGVPVSDAGNISVSSTVSNVLLPQTTSTDKPMSLPKTTTIPTLSSIGGNHSALPKSSTLPNVHTSRPLISRPILQTATPSAASLIERAPSTGVSQSSILGGSSKVGKTDKASRGVVFCEPLTLPSPTNPNHPPIIHQQSITSNLPTPTQSSVSTVLATQKFSSQPPDLPIQKSIGSIYEKGSENTTTVILPNTTSVDFTPTWKTEPKPLPADAFVCNINDGKSQKTSDRGNPSFTLNSNSNKDACISSPDSDKGMGQFSKLKSKLAHVKRTPTSERHKMDKSEKVTEDNRSLSPTSSLRSFDGPPKPDRGNLRNLQISNPILQTAVDIKTNLVPVCRPNDDVIASSIADTLRSTSVSPSPPRSTPGTHILSINSESLDTNSSSIAKVDSMVKIKGKAPQPPQIKKVSTSSLEGIPSSIVSKSTINTGPVKNDEKDNKTLLSNISRRLSNRTKYSDRRDSAPEACTTTTTKVPNSPSVSSILKQSNADDKILNPNKAGITSFKETKPPKHDMDRHPPTIKSKRPASIATTRPVRPTAPPPPRPQSSSRSQTSPTRSDTGSIASSTSSINAPSNRSEPIYHTIRENPLEEKLEATSITSPLSDDFVTPTSSPILTRRNSDTISTGSSTDGGDLMNAILKEVTAKTTEEEESVYSTLIRKKKNRLSKSTNEH